MMAEKKSQSLGFLLRDYWTGIINGIGKSDDVGGKFDYFNDSKALVSRLKSFAGALSDFVAEVKEIRLGSKFLVFKKTSHVEMVKIKLMPKPMKERHKLELTLSIDLRTRKSYVFLNSKIGLSGCDYVFVKKEDIRNLDVDATLEDLRGFVEKYQDYKAGAEKIAEEKRTEELKRKKLAEMASKSIEAVVPQIMATSGYEWNLESEYKYFGRGGSPDRYILRIKMKKHKMIEITLNQNNFANKIPEILNVVAQIEKLLEQVPYAVNVLNYGPNICWIKGTEYVK